MKDQNSVGNNSNQGASKDSNIPNVVSGSSNLGAMSAGNSGGTILIAPSTGGGVPMPMPIIPVVNGNGVPLIPINVGGQPSTNVIVPMPPVHMNHQGGGVHDGGDRDTHSYNGQQSGGPLVEQSQGQGPGQHGSMKQIPQQLMRPQQQQQQQQIPNQMPQQMQQQQMMFSNNPPMGQGGRPMQGQQPIQMMIQPQMFQNQQFYANPNQPNQGQQIMYMPRGRCVLKNCTHSLDLLIFLFPIF